MEQDQFMTREDVAEQYGVSRRTLERWAQQGIGPTPLPLGPRMIRYRRSEVVAWPAQQDAQLERTA